jgi:hypothetical protein
MRTLFGRLQRKRYFRDPPSATHDGYGSYLAKNVRQTDMVFSREESLASYEERV